MKRIVTILLIAVMALAGCAALAEGTYASDDLSFSYDAQSFEVTTDYHADDNQMVILSGKNDAWGAVAIRIELKDGEAFPTPETLAAPAGAEVTQGEWHGFQDVLMYTTSSGSFVESVFVAPVRDDDGEIDDTLTVTITVDDIGGEAAMARDDRISAVLDTLKVDD